MKLAVQLLLFLLVPAVMFAVPWWTLVAAPTGGSGPLFRIGTALCVLGVIGLPLAMFLGHGPMQSDPASIIGDTALGVLWVVFCWSVIGVFVRGVLAVAGVEGRLAAKIVAVGVAVTAVSLSSWGVYEARKVPQVRTVEVAITGLADGMDGLRMVVITDTHFAALDRQRWSEQVVDVINAQNPDIVAHAGDLADGSVEKRSAQVDPLGKVDAPLGRFYITGNHEYFGDAQGWIDHMASLGWQPLHNEHHTVTRGEDQLVIAGIDDPTGKSLPGHGPDLPRALSGADPEVPVVLLAHQPKQIVDSAAAGVALQVSGHTHGGQIWPFHYLVRLDQPVVAGLSRHADNTQLYTSRGTGFWGPQLRVFAPSEITVLVLRVERNAS